MPNIQALLRLLKLVFFSKDYVGLPFCFFLLSLQLSAQRPQYLINATLDTRNHTITATMSIDYTNNSEVALDKIGVHLWANAYGPRKSDFSRQMLDINKPDFYFASADQLGGYEELAFSCPDQEITLSYANEGHDIAWINLNKPLEPGETIHLDSKFLLRIPKSFSRMGRTGDSYQLTQWYPHIAVLDNEGWHMIPYLDQGEYFNDFADYKVHLSVPNNLTIAATGVEEVTNEDDSATTWTFTAENVIDFAWFASPGFKKSEKILEWSPGRKVTLKIYEDFPYDSNWNHAMEYAERALRFYSDWLGPYPYPTMSVVSAPYSKGGYMEYPMVAQIGSTSDAAFLDIVIAHEIGHTWLYGILASDERSTPWMDEGLNTFFERKYTKQLYPDYSDVVYVEQFSDRFSMPQHDALENNVRLANQLQPPSADPQFQSENQYLFSAYQLPAYGLEMMQSRYGEAQMKKMFTGYFEDRKFTHVAPVDMRVSFERKCGCDLSWFFDGWIHQAHEVEYDIKKFNPKAKEVTIVNKGTPDVPLQLTTYLGQKEVNDYWIDGFRGVKTIHLDNKADHVQLYKDNPQTNGKWWAQTKPGNWLPHFTILPRIGSYSSGQISVSPFIGRNDGDGLLPGVVLMSDLVPQRKFKWILAPLYGLGSHKLRGYAEGRLITNIKNSIFDKFLISSSVNYFGYSRDTHYLFRDSYLKLSPSVALRATPNNNHPHVTQWWKYRWVNIHQYYGRGLDFESKEFVEEQREYAIHELAYQLRSDFILRPFTFRSDVQAGKGFVRLNFNFQQHFIGRNTYKGLWVHAYAGYQPIRDQPVASTYFTLSGISSYGFYSTDYMFDQWLGGRNKNSGIFSRQIFLKDAGFKTLATNGISEEGMIAAGFSWALPAPVFHLYMDAAAYKSGVTEKNVISYSGGLAVVLLKDVFEIYVPLLESKDIRESLSYEVRNIWHKRISFQANFKLLNPIDVADRLTLRY